MCVCIIIDLHSFVERPKIKTKTKKFGILEESFKDCCKIELLEFPFHVNDAIKATIRYLLFEGNLFYKTGFSFIFSYSFLFSKFHALFSLKQEETPFL